MGGVVRRVTFAFEGRVSIVLLFLFSFFGFCGFIVFHEWCFFFIMCETFSKFILLFSRVFPLNQYLYWKLRRVEKKYLVVCWGGSGGVWKGWSEGNSKKGGERKRKAIIFDGKFKWFSGIYLIKMQRIRPILFTGRNWCLWLDMREWGWFKGCGSIFPESAVELLLADGLIYQHVLIGGNWDIAARVKLGWLGGVDLSQSFLLFIVGELGML